MMRNFSPLRPFRFWCQKVLPLVYDDSLSYYEVLCKVVDYLNKTREDLSNFITNWSAPIVVSDYNDMTDKDKIYLYVGDQEGYNKYHWYYFNPDTNQWEDGGEYGSLWFDKSALPAEIGYNFRKIDRQFIVNNGVNAYNQHGGCAISNSEVVYALLDYNYRQNNVAHIISHNIDEHAYTEKGQVIIGHCDSMAYDMENDILYIATAYKAVNGVEIPDGSIYVYRYSDLTLLDVIANVNANSVGFDNENGKMYFTTFDNEWKDEDGETLFTFDTSWTNSRQGIFIYDGGYYLVTAFPNNIREFDETGRVVRDIPFRETYDYYTVGEVQWASTVGDRLLVGTMIDSEDATEKYPSVWETNLKTNIRPSHDFSNSHVMNTMHVNASSTSFCPTGSTGQPFKSINEAMLYSNCRTTIHEMDLYDGEYKGRINQNMRILGNGSTILEPTFKACVARIEGCSQVNNAVIPDGCYVESEIEFTPQLGKYYLTKTFTESVVQNTGWTFSAHSNFIRDHSVFLKLEMSNENTPSSSWITIVTGYPKPKQNWYATNVDKGGNVYRLRVNTDGELAIANFSNHGLDIDDTFVYPI